jgi:hypothetical protein
MTSDDVIRLAREAGMALGFTQGVAVMNHENLERFAALVAAHEREECARILDVNVDCCNGKSAMRDVLEGNALAIRARGE